MRQEETLKVTHDVSQTLQRKLEGMLIVLLLKVRKILTR